jgi:hypothetical protein
MLLEYEGCKTFGSTSTESMSCVWVETENHRCKTKQKSCGDISGSEEWCETEGCVFGETSCIWIEENINNDEDAKCMNEVLFIYLLEIYIYLLLLLLYLYYLSFFLNTFKSEINLLMIYI